MTVDVVIGSGALVRRGAWCPLPPESLPWGPIPWPPAPLARGTQGGGAAQLHDQILRVAQTVVQGPPSSRTGSTQSWTTLQRWLTLISTMEDLLRPATSLVYTESKALQGPLHDLDLLALPDLQRLIVRLHGQDLLPEPVKRDHGSHGDLLCRVRFRRSPRIVPSTVAVCLRPGTTAPRLPPWIQVGLPSTMSRLYVTPSAS